MGISCRKIVITRGERSKPNKRQPLIAKEGIYLSEYQQYPPIPFAFVRNQTIATSDESDITTPPGTLEHQQTASTAICNKKTSLSFWGILFPAERLQIPEERVQIGSVRTCRQGRFSGSYVSFLGAEK
jgi:hypothetical protein